MKDDIGSLYKKIKEKIGTLVEVRTIDDRIIIGKLASFNPEDGSILLEKAIEKNRRIPSIYISGVAVAQINFFEKENKEEEIDDKVAALLKVDPSLTYEEIAKILDIPIQVAQRIVKRLMK
ncbi:MAG: winged helix-turn-helix transcriptional regulator [Thermoproteota archaeon]|nr:winged helix-turn-helix transcriptional regulator [Thermoproteota archaeon]